MIQNLILGAMLWLSVGPPVGNSWSIESTVNFSSASELEASLELAGTGMACVDWGDGERTCLSLPPVLPADSSAEAGFGQRVEHRYLKKGNYPVRIWGWGRLQSFGGDWDEMHSCYQGLKITGCEGLRRLNCRGFGMGTLDVSRFSELEILLCGENDLTELDVSRCPELRELDCSGWCPFVDPIDELEPPRYLNPSLRRLDVSRNRKLRRLNCSSNEMTQLVLGSKPELVELDCSICRLATLYLRGCPRLEVLACDFNRLTALDLSSFRHLRDLDCSHNPIRRLDVSRLPDLEVLDCSVCRLTVLDLRENRKLVELSCYGDCYSESMGWLRQLLLGDKPELNMLDCSYNRLTELDLRRCPKLGHLDCQQNSFSPQVLKRIIATLPFRLTESKLPRPAEQKEESPGWVNLDCIEDRDRQAAEAKGWKVIAG